MAENRLRKLHDAGQAVWLDYIDRTLLQDGTLQHLIRDDALMGMTSNPTIFEKALSEGTAYDAQIAALAGEYPPPKLFEADGDGRRPHGMRHLRRCIQVHTRRRRAGVHRGVAWAGLRHQWDHRGSPEALGDA